jgi:hypothetical protein
MPYILSKTLTKGLYILTRVLASLIYKEQSYLV